MEVRFRDRSQAGRLLAARLQSFASRTDVIVLALPRGGVPVAFEVAQALNAPLDVLLVRKLGLPSQPEVAFGALASGGICVFNESLLSECPISTAEIAAVIARERQELERREELYRGARPFPTLRNRLVILVDDGMATGTTMLAAVTALKTRQPARIVIAVPVAAAEACTEFEQMGAPIQLVYLLAPTDFWAVGLWYEYFPQTTDEEVRALLERASQYQPHQPSKHLAPPA
jgi:putative phosphoribosyl transferase